MTQTGFSGFRKNLIFRPLVLVVLMLSSLSLTAQKLPDFSGVWIQDTIKSDGFYKNFNVKCSIEQTPQMFKIVTTFSYKAGKEQVKRESSFTLDGKETTDAKGAKKSAKWSTDQKVLTTSDTKNYGGDVVGVTTSYSISADGRILSVKTKDINPLVEPLNQVFNKGL